jgi:antitoxin ParD1/3/4
VKVHPRTACDKLISRLFFTRVRQLEEFVGCRVASGRYQTASEVVREGLRLLEPQERDREAARIALKKKLKNVEAQAQRGELINGEEFVDKLLAGPALQGQQLQFSVLHILRLVIAGYEPIVHPQCHSNHFFADTVEGLESRQTSRPRLNWLRKNWRGLRRMKTVCRHDRVNGSS